MKLTKIMAMFFAATTIFATACSEEDKNNDGIDSGKARCSLSKRVPP